MTMIDINPFDLPSVFLTEKQKLPKISAVYFAITPSGKIAYIGSTSNLYTRIYSHGKREEFSDFRYIKIAWFECASDIRESLEYRFINKFRPILNRRGMPSTPEEDIEENPSLHLDRQFMSDLIDGIIDDDCVDIVIAMEIGFL